MKAIQWAQLFLTEYTSNVRDHDLAMQAMPSIPENRGQVSCSDGPPLLSLAWGWLLGLGLACSRSLLSPTKATVCHKHLL